MPQSNVIFAFLFVGFVMWITVKGELQTYLTFLLSAAQCGASGNGAGTNTSTSNAIVNPQTLSQNINPALTNSASALASTLPALAAVA